MPIIDLVYVGRKLCAIDGGDIVLVAVGSPNLEKGMVYEMDVVKDPVDGKIQIVKPRMRAAKTVPNSMDVVKRAVASESKDTKISTALLDITSMSLSMSERVFTIAQTKAHNTKKVVVIFGAGRFQAWREIITSKTSYIAIDPEIDDTLLTRHTKRFAVMHYDLNTPFEIQVKSISKRPYTVLWAKCKSEYFINMTMPTRITFINRLRTEGVPMFGCRFVHDSMPICAVGSGIVTMIPKGQRRGSNSYIEAKLGKSTYIAPYLSRSSVPDLVLVENEMPELWVNVDVNTMPIMERVVMLYVF
ncbi:hypothetical protein GGR56DRAFT_684339 [Xylariaceae sp. FL0804]|nr:hypothetical protein GGR56DRAFT_684339 [Xylariaceae sp. FL0804]